MKKSYFKQACLRRQGFTLIELLVVVGILAILAIAALVAINPLEAQRKSRDATRLKDLATLQSAVVQWVSDNGAPAVLINVTSSGAPAATARNCNGGWLGAGRNFCPYLSTIPVDPSFPANAGYTNAAGTLHTAALAGYRVRVETDGEYGISTRLESFTNAPRLGQDGIPDICYTVYSDVVAGTAACP